jgi:hypothetical protein
VLAAGHVIEEDHLDVLRALNSLAVGTIAWGWGSRVHVDQLSVTLVSEHQTFF